jgi:outer membrane protein OmpA-like peptidoglycan-associated protein
MVSTRSWRASAAARHTVESCPPEKSTSGRDQRGREIIIIDNSYRDPRGGCGFYVALAPPVVRMPYNRYIVDSEEASPEVLYETMMAPPVERIERRYSLDEIRYSPTVRQRMPSIDVNTINFELGSWEIPPDQAAKLQAIADGLNRAIEENPRAVFLIEGHTDAVGNDVDNLSLSDRRAESAAALLTQQFGVPAENLTSQGYGEQYPRCPSTGHGSRDSGRASPSMPRRIVREPRRSRSRAR